MGRIFPINVRRPVRWFAFLRNLLHPKPSVTGVKSGSPFLFDLLFNDHIYYTIQAFLILKNFVNSHGPCGKSSPICQAPLPRRP